MRHRRTRMPSRLRAGRALVAGLLAVTVLGATACSAPRSTQTLEESVKASDAAVLDVLNRYVAAWNAGDGRKFGTTYAPEATHVTFDGTLLKGQAEITRVHSQLFDTFLRDSRIELEVDDLRFVTDDVAVLHTSGGIVEPGDTTLSPDRRSMNTMIITRHPGNWLIETVQVTRIAASTPPG